MNNKEQNQSKAHTKITIGLILSWGLGVLAAISGVTLLFSQLLTGILMLLLAAALLPPVNKFVADKWHFSISGGLKFVVVIILLGVIWATMSTDSTSNSNTSTVPSAKQVAKTADVQEKNKTTNKNEVTKTKSTPAKKQDLTPKKSITTPTQVKETGNQNIVPAPSETVSQKNAVRSAKSYLDYSAFSHDGLVAQLEYGQFSQADAIYGADNSGADWNKQAAKSAKSYMEYSAFSRGSLIKQLKYSKFTQAQAEYGANAIGL